MAQDLLQSLAELDAMLRDMEKNTAPDATFLEEPVEEESPYCIKNGAYIRVDETGMNAWMYLNPPKEGEKEYSRWDIMQFVKENNISMGFHHSNISAVAKKHIYEREVLVATGEDPIEGKPGFYEYFFDTSDKRRPAIREDGTVDYSSVSTLSNVRKGDVIAKYYHSVQSKDGFDVYGNPIPAKPARDLPPLRGRGLKQTENPDVYVADVDGKIDFVDGRVDIKNVHEITGDVDLIVGKVEFFGDIHITGSVGSGVLIRASRNVTVDGFVEGATIFAGGDVVLSRGVNGGMKGKIAARGNVLAEFIENANVEAGGEIRSNSFINSNVYAGKTVIAEGRNGVIIGGNVRGLYGVTAQNIGNSNEIKTMVFSGYSEEDHERYLNLVNQENETQAILSEVVERMTTILKDRRLGREKNSEESDIKLRELNERKDEYFEKLDKIRTQKEMITDIIEKGKGSMILANDHIYRGTQIGIEGARLLIKENTRFMRYRKEGGNIVGKVIVVN